MTRLYQHKQKPRLDGASRDDLRAKRRPRTAPERRARYRLSAVSIALLAMTAGAALSIFLQGWDKQFGATSPGAVVFADEKNQSVTEPSTEVAGASKAPSSMATRADATRRMAEYMRAMANTADIHEYAMPDFESAVRTVERAAAIGDDYRAAAALYEQAVSEFAGLRALAFERKAAPPQPGETRTFDGMEFVWIPSGSFMMGSPPDERGRRNDEGYHRVTLSRGFWLGKYEVTKDEWERVMGSRLWQGRRYVLDEGDSPAVYVSWYHCQEFIWKLNKGVIGPYRLPTEAEWEYACRAGSTTAYSFGDSAANLGKYAWYYENTRDTEEKYGHRVGEKQPNDWGLHDMHGNVMEWCSDQYGAYPSRAVTDPANAGVDSARVMRGGSWGHMSRSCRSAKRTKLKPLGRGGFTGVRLLREEPVQ